MRMVIFAHDSDRRDDFDFPTDNFFKVVIFHNPLHMAFLFHSLYIMLGFVRNIKIFCLDDLFWFQGLLKQGYSSRKLQTTFRNFYGRHTDLVHKLDTCVSHMLKGLFTNSDI